VIHTTPRYHHGNHAPTLEEQIAIAEDICFTPLGLPQILKVSHDKTQDSWISASDARIFQRLLSLSRFLESISLSGNY